MRPYYFKRNLMACPCFQERIFYRQEYFCTIGVFDESKMGLDLYFFSHWGKYYLAQLILKTLLDHVS
jgi:hypothetical protein